MESNCGARLATLRQGSENVSNALEWNPGRPRLTWKSEKLGQLWREVKPTAA